MEKACGMTGNMLQLENVRLCRGQREVLADVTFGVARGEIVALMGPSGSGKTTVLRLIAGLEPFQAGMVQVEDLALIGNGFPVSPSVRTYAGDQERLARARARARCAVP